MKIWVFGEYCERKRRDYTYFGKFAQEKQVD